MAAQRWRRGIVLDGDGWSTPRPGRFIPRERHHQMPIVREGVWTKKPPGVSRRTVEPVASRYTECVIAAHEIEMA
jgi:hypothetical protein